VLKWGHFCRYSGKIPTSKSDVEQRTWPKHVLRRDWLPLNDLLGHINTKLLINHCGANSQFEVRLYSDISDMVGSIVLLLAHLMGQHCFACWRLSSVVVCNAVGGSAGRPPGAWTLGAPGVRAR